jgi:single-stranded-DNA-specific exonuclease
MSVQHALLGDRELREPQREVLTAIRAGENVLAVFGTGQGKSVLYQIPAIESALRGLKTIIFHPLRALANDQFATMQKALVSFPEVRLLRANGSITKEERDELNGALKNGSWDILLATPEFARHHLEVFAQPWNQPALVVLDEAHHLYESRHRPAYHSFGETLARLGSPQTTAFTATARDDAFNHIVDVLGITTWVINPAVRGNLKIVDRRNELNRLAYLQALAAQKNAKTIVYCNSRKETFALASALSLGCAGVAAYNAEMDPRQRTLIEQQFRANELHFVVATSAFGEGIDLPDVRHVVLYHLL